MTLGMAWEDFCSRSPLPAALVGAQQERLPARARDEMRAAATVAELPGLVKLAHAIEGERAEALKSRFYQTLGINRYRTFCIYST
jgi:hypothetical protein